MSHSGCDSGRFDKSRTIEAERKINEDPEFRKIDELCKTIPIPEGSEFVGKARMFNSIGLSNFYYTTQNFDILEDFFKKHFVDNEWEHEQPDSLSRILIYRKGETEVEIQFGEIGRDISYSIYCGKVK
jgi:hypothetical protein